MSGDSEIKDAVVSGTDSDAAETESEDSGRPEKRMSAREIFKASQSDSFESDKVTDPVADDSEPPESLSESDDVFDPSHYQEDSADEQNVELTNETETPTANEDDEQNSVTISEFADSDIAGDGEDDDNILFLENSEDDTPEDILLSRLESLIFIYPEPITVRRLAKHLSLSGKRVRELVEILKTHYAERGINLSEISGGFQFHTNPQNAEVIRTLTKVKPMKMSRPALETLAIVAYKQPCTRAEVEDVRRVDCGGTLKFLFEKELIRVLGRKEEPGRPIIYGTSSKFLEMFNLKSLTDLPSLHEYTELWDEHKELVDDDDNAGADFSPTESLRNAERQQSLPVDAPVESDTEEPDDDTDNDTDDREYAGLPDEPTEADNVTFDGALDAPSPETGDTDDDDTDENEFDDDDTDEGTSDEVDTGNQNVDGDDDGKDDQDDENDDDDDAPDEEE